METPATEVRLALTISGAVSLGAFEGGVLAALVTAVRALEGTDGPPVRIDAIGGASAGAMTALLTARCLTTAVDPVKAMKTAWVTGDSIQKLLHTHGDSPLSAEVLRQLAAEVFSDQVPGADQHRDAPVRLVLALCALRGLEYDIRQPGADPVEATTYLDLATFDVTRDWTAAHYLEPDHASPAEAAIASGANEFGFPAQYLDRSADAADYAARGLTGPAVGLWYTDGGTLDNEPLGHTADLSDQLDDGAPAGIRRIHVLIHPNVSGGPTGEAWADPDDPPTWVATLHRAFELQRTQSLFDDLRTLAKTSTRIRWLDQVLGTVESFVETLPTDDQARLHEALADTFGAIQAEKAGLPGAAPGPELPPSAAELLGLAVETATGLGPKRRVGIEVISPLRLAKENDVPIERMLAGAALGHFGGFFDEKLRLSDFDLGYQCATTWMTTGGWERCGLSPGQASTAVQAVSAAYEAEERWKEEGRTSVLDIARHHPLALAGLLGQVARVTVRDALHRHHDPPPPGPH
jgi:hypothetical protein